MFDPFTTWTRTMAAMTGIARTAQRSAEIADQSRDIVAKRTTMIDTAMRNPWRGDYAELSRMLPEKLDAFSRSAVAVGTELAAMNMAFLTEAQHVAALTLRGRPMGIEDWSVLTTRTASYAMQSAERMAALASKALAPVDAVVTANTKRLRHR